MKKSKLIAVAAVVVIAAVLVLPRFLKREEEPAAAALPVVSVAKPEIGDIEIYTELSGSVQPSDMASVIPKAAGEVTEVYVKAGDMVTEGQPICHIDTKQVDTAKNSMDLAAVSLKNANQELDRMRALFATGAISQQNLEQAQTAAETARLQYESAKIAYNNQVEFSSITAPISGLVESFNVEVHDNVTSQNVICVISGEGNKEVRFAVTDRVVGGLHLGDAIEVDKNGSTYVGVISEISTKIDDATGLFNVKASMAEAEALATGSRVKLSVVSEKAEQALTVPTNAVYYSGGEPRLYLYSDGAVHEAPVEIGIYDADKTQILSGVTEEDQVIVTWSSELFEGSRVQLADGAGQAAGPEAAGSEETGQGTDQAAGPETAGSEETGSETAGPAEAGSEETAVQAEE